MDRSHTQHIEDFDISFELRDMIQRLMSILEGEKNYEKQQQAYLEEQIDIIQENINLLNAELEALKTDISTTETTIKTLETDIENQEKDIENKIDLFKTRLRSMYMSGGNNYASVLAGSTDFYDLLTRMELVERVAEHDDKMIDDLNEMLDNLEATKAEVEEKKAEAVYNLTMAELLDDEDELE